MTLAVKNETKNLKAVLNSKGAIDSIEIENIFEKCRHDEEKNAQISKSVLSNLFN